MTKNIHEIKKRIKTECELDKKLQGWYYDVHLLGVEKFAKEILKKYPGANREVVLLGVWLHDLQRIRRAKGDHEKMGAREASKFLKEYGYSKETIKRVKDIILTHSCEDHMPSSLEGKILSTADAMAFYYKDFVLIIAVKGERNIDAYKKWVLEKLNRNYNKKIFFKFAKKKIKNRHDLLKRLIMMG